MGTRRAPSLEVDAMENRIVVGTMNSPSCQVSSQVSAHFESMEFEGLEHSVTSVQGFESGIESLSEGDLDLLAIPATEIINREEEISARGCQVIGARTPRRPSLVLVSPDRLMYQPKSAIIVSDSGLIRRQLLRVRPDLQATSSEELGSIVPGFKLPADSEDIPRKLAELLDKGEIDGFVISRAEYDGTGQTERRHTLMPQPKERGAPHFVPRPYSDLIAVVSRVGYPNRLAAKLTEPEGNTVLWTQNRIMGDLDPSIHDFVGLEVRHRQVGAILRQAEANHDLVLEQSCHDPDGEIFHDEVRVEIRIETLSQDGRRTLSLERLVAMSEYQRAVIALLMDWRVLVTESTREVPRDHPTDDDAPPFLPE
tara:strand:- start:8021 stop:9124 length:1104 start_codon:yes stop_codon:yes gene_type:complete